MTADLLAGREVYLICRRWGLTPDEAVTAVVVAEAASGLDPFFQLLTTDAETSTYRGLFGVEVRRDDPGDRMGLFRVTANIATAVSRFVTCGRAWSWSWVWPIANLDELRERVIAELGEVYDRQVGELAEKVEA
jgi:hypothetical protein